MLMANSNFNSAYAFKETIKKQTSVREISMA